MRYTAEQAAYIEALYLHATKREHLLTAVQRDILRGRLPVTMETYRSMRALRQHEATQGATG